MKIVNLIQGNTALIRVIENKNNRNRIIFFKVSIL